MRRLAIAVFAWAAFALPAQAQFKAPEDGVRAVYALYATPDSNGMPRNAKTAARFFEPSLAKAWTSAKNVDADFFIQGQDFEIAGLKVGKAAVQGDKATVVVDFTNFKKPHRLTYEMAKGKDGWRISDVKAGRDSFRAMLRKSR